MVKNILTAKDIATTVSSLLPTLPEQVLRSFFFIRKALHSQRYDAVLAMAVKYARLHPHYAGYFFEMAAIAHKECDHIDAAIERFEAAHDFFDRKNLPVLLNLASALRECKNTDAALVCIEDGLTVFPDNAHVLCELWRIRFAQGRIAEAAQGMRALCAAHPSHMHYYYYAEFAFALGLYEESMAAFDKAHEMQALDDLVWSNHIFLAHYVPTHSADDLRALLRRCHDVYAAYLPPTPPEALARDTMPGRPLRIGILSAGLRLHPVGWMAARTVRLLAALGDYEFYIYNTGSRPADDADPFTALFKQSAAQWLDVGRWPHEKLYTRLLTDRLDMALDMAGHADGGRAHFFVQRIAPVQIKWVGGLFNTSGIAAMDYLLSDEYETPHGSPTADAQYSEKIIRLPHSYVAYAPPDYGHEVRPVPRLTDINDGRVCFGSFNNAYKINPVIVAVWARILHRVPASFMYIKDGKLDGPVGRDAQERIRKIFAAHGIGADRLLLEGRSVHSALLTCYNRVDIALDTWPYTGGLTTLEALWMGVPVITTPGPSFAGRHACSHLYNAGLEEFVTQDFHAYEALAVELAQRPETLDSLRFLLRLRLLESPLLDHAQRAADLDTALRTAWTRHCEGLPPVPMRFDAPTVLTERHRHAWDIA